MSRHRGGRGDDRLLGEDEPDSMTGGGGGNDNLEGGFGNDTIVGGAGNDLLEGNGGIDVFLFGAAGGADSFDDFQDGIDLLQILAAGVLDFGDVTVTGTLARAVVAFDSGGTTTEVTLLGVDASRLGAADFLFA
jgi:Ca2+-binding RTX toxin-like protein